MDRASDVAGGLSGFMVLFVALITFYEIVARFLFNAPTTWVLDVSTYTLVWLGFLSASYGVSRSSHIRMDLFISRLGPTTRLALSIVAHALVLCLSLVLTVSTWNMVAFAYVADERSASVLRLPLYLVRLGPALGSVLLALQSLRMLVQQAAEYSQARSSHSVSREQPLLVTGVFLILVGVAVALSVIKPEVGLPVLLLVLLSGGVPVFTALGLVGVAGLFLLVGVDAGLPQVGIVANKALESYTLLAIPLYLLAGSLLHHSGIGSELYNAVARWVGHWPGGYGVATAVACAFFAGVSGSSVADAAAIGTIAYPEMLKRGYNRRLVLGLVAAGGTLGILIPPSASMIIYSSITEESTGALFMGGLVPGIVLVTLFALYTSWATSRSGYERVPRASWEERWKATRQALWGLLLPVVIIGGIYGGIFTPTEAAAVAVVYAVVLSLARRRLSLWQVGQILKESTKATTMIMMIVVGALQMGTVVTLLQVPQRVIEWVSSLQVPAGVLLAVLAGIYVVLGMFLEAVSIQYITLPIVYPLVRAAGIDGLWFGLFITVLMEVALITPPVGLNLFAVQGVSGASLEEVTRGVGPYVLLLLFFLLLLTVFPQIGLWLPKTMGLGS